MVTGNKSFDDLLMRAADSIVAANTRRIQLEQQAFASEQATKEQIRHAKLQQDSLKLQTDNFELEKQKFSFQQEMQKAQLELDKQKLAMSGQTGAAGADSLKTEKDAVQIALDKQKLRQQFQKLSLQDTSRGAIDAFQGTNAPRATKVGGKTVTARGLSEIFPAGVEALDDITSYAAKQRAQLQFDLANPAISMITPEKRAQTEADIEYVTQFASSPQFETLRQQSLAGQFPGEAEEKAARNMGFGNAESARLAMQVETAQDSQIRQIEFVLQDTPNVRALQGQEITPDAVNDLRGVFGEPDKTKRENKAAAVYQYMKLLGYTQEQIDDFFLQAQTKQ